MCLWPGDVWRDVYRCACTYVYVCEGGGGRVLHGVSECRVCVCVFVCVRVCVRGMGLRSWWHACMYVCFACMCVVCVGECDVMWNVVSRFMCKCRCACAFACVLGLYVWGICRVVHSCVRACMHGCMYMCTASISAYMCVGRCVCMCVCVWCVCARVRVARWCVMHACVHVLHVCVHVCVCVCVRVNYFSVNTTPGFPKKRLDHGLPANHLLNDQMTCSTRSRPDSPSRRERRRSVTTNSVSTSTYTATSKLTIYPDDHS